MFHKLNNTNILYAIDDKKLTPGVLEVLESQARELNGRGWGIFHTPNSFSGKRRLENLLKINYWFIDIDEGHKEEHLKRIKAAPARPGVVVETKNGFHCYWRAKEAGLDKFYEIEERLIWHFGADPQVKDVPRLLRMPGFYHNKSEPFMIRVVEENDRAYSEAEMLFAFRAKPKPKVVYKDFSMTNVDLSSLDKLLKPQYIKEGERNGKIFRKGVFLKKIGLSQSQVEDCLRWLNNNISRPLDEWELNLILRGYDKWTA